MALFNIGDFKQALTGGGARPTFFDIRFLNVPAGVPDLFGGDPNRRLLVSATALPGVSIGPIEQAFQGRTVKFAGNKVYEDWSTTIINDENFSIRNGIIAWMNLIEEDDRSGAQRGAGVTNAGPSAYTGDGYVIQLGKRGDALRSYRFHNIWPQSLGDISVGHGETDSFEEFEVTWSYDFWTDEGATLPGNAPVAGTG